MSVSSFIQFFIGTRERYGAEEIALQLSVAIMKLAQDQQKMAGQAIVNMINQRLS
jgi:hypothetical protein